MLSADLLAALARFGDVVSAREVVGGRGGRTFAVEYAGSGATVVHLRSSGAESISREAVATRAAYAIGVGPELLDVVPGVGAIVTRWVPGASLTAADLQDDEVLRDVARVLRRLHDAPPPDELPDLDVLGSRRDYLAEAERRGIAWTQDIAREQRRTDIVAVELARDLGIAPVLCHGDLVPDNLVRGAAGIVLLDFEYAGRGETAMDLGGLAAAAGLPDSAVASLVASYEEAGGAADLARVIAWRDVTRHAWFVWVALGDDLGSQRQHWEVWASGAREAWRDI